MEARPLLLSSLSGIALAATSGAALAAGPDRADDRTIIVSAPVKRELGSALSGISVVSGDELAREVRPTIGETLTHSPGVSSTSFGPNASRPILRGFQGERVRVLTDGIGSFDVSNTSVDHAVTINPLTAERIEVLRGPSALLYGSSAIGGVVNVIDGRIPLHEPGSLSARMTATYGSAARERSVAATADAPLGGGFVAHLDGSTSWTGDLKTGGHLLSAPLRAQALASPDPAVRALAGLAGRLPNSAAHGWDISGALAYFGAGSNAGISVTRHEALYGVPPRFSLDPAHRAEMVQIDVAQTRVDGRLNLDLGGGLFDKLRLRGGYADYAHAEIDETGVIGTQFFNKGGEARLELVQARRGPWDGAVGAQFLERHFRVTGDEKFLPPSASSQFGLFAVQDLHLGATTFEAGARYERSSHRAAADADIGNPAISRQFDALSVSLGASHMIAPGWRIGLNASRSARAPSPEELFANGPHAGTQAFEIGDPGLGVERAWGLEATLHGHSRGFNLDASLYRSWFSNYIYEVDTGVAINGLPVFQTHQAGARYWGLEVQASATLAHAGNVTIRADGLVDYVEADIIGSGPVPRIPPLRLLGGIEAQTSRWTARAEVEHVTPQSRVAINETATPGHIVANASVTLHPLEAKPDLALTLSADNIFDAVARRHASFLKDYAPLAGRDIRISVRLGF